MASQTSNGFHVAIVGAGIAGLALAMALHKRNISFTLYEEAAEFSAVGAGIGFAPNGMRAIDAIEPRFRALYEKVCVGNKRSDARHVFFEGMLLEKGLGEGQPWFGNSSWGHPEFDRKSVRLPARVTLDVSRSLLTDVGQAHRRDLLEIMTSFMPPENVRFSKRLTTIHEHPEKVVLNFADGDVEEASILAGADGIKSGIRKHVLEPLYPEQVDPVYADAYCYRAVIPMAEADEIMGDLTDIAKFYFGHDRSAVTYRITGGKEFNFLLCVADPNPWKLDNAVTETVSHDAMMDDFASDSIDERFRRLLSKANPIKWGLFHHPQTSTYYRGRVVLLGDSAHASLPFQAAGAAQGLEDALVLSSVLAELAELQRNDIDIKTQIEVGLEAYDSVRRPRAQKQLEQSAEVSRMLFFQHGEAGDDMGKILPMLQQGRFNWLWFHDIKDDAEVARLKVKQQRRRPEGLDGTSADTSFGNGG